MRGEWAGKAKRGAGGGDVLEGDVVHDDETVEVRHECGNLAAIREDEQMIRQAEGIAVALDATLRIEHKAIVSRAFGETLNVVGEHAVEPADAVRAADGDLSAIAEIEGPGAFDEGGKFLSGDAEGREAAGSGELFKISRGPAKCLGEGRGRAHRWGRGYVWGVSKAAGGGVLHGESSRKIIAF